MQLKTIDYVMCMDQDIIDTVDNKREFYNLFFPHNFNYCTFYIMRFQFKCHEL